MRINTMLKYILGGTCYHSDNGRGLSVTKNILPALIMALLMVSQANAQHPRTRAGNQPVVSSGEQIQPQDASKTSSGSESESQRKLDGTWDAVLTTGDGFEFSARYTFTHRQSEDGGSLINTAEFDSEPAFPCGMAHGDWSKIAPRKFVLISEQFCIDRSGGGEGLAFHRVARIQDTITLNKRGDQFTGSEKYLLMDRDRNILFETTFTVRAKRQNTEPF